MFVHYTSRHDELGQSLHAAAGAPERSPDSHAAPHEPAEVISRCASVRIRNHALARLCKPHLFSALPVRRARQLHVVAANKTEKEGTKQEVFLGVKGNAQLLGMKGASVRHALLPNPRPTTLVTDGDQHLEDPPAAHEASHVDPPYLGRALWRCSQWQLSVDT